MFGPQWDQSLAGKRVNADKKATYDKRLAGSKPEKKKMAVVGIGVVRPSDIHLEHPELVCEMTEKRIHLPLIMAEG